MLSDPTRLSTGQLFHGHATRVVIYASYQAGLEFGKSRANGTGATRVGTSSTVTEQYVLEPLSTATSNVMETAPCTTSSLSMA